MNHTKFFGLYFDEKMPWNYCIESIGENCGKVICLLRKSFLVQVLGTARSIILYLHKTLDLIKIDLGLIYMHRHQNLF